MFSWFHISPTLVSINSLLLITLTVSFSALPCISSLLVRLPASQELLQVVSYKTKDLVFKPAKLTNCNSVTWNSPLRSVTNDVVVVVSGYLLYFELCCQKVEYNWDLLTVLLGKPYHLHTIVCYANYCTLLPGLLFVKGTGGMCLYHKHEKQSLLSTTNLALWVGDFSLKTRHSHGRWLTLHAMQQE